MKVQLTAMRVQPLPDTGYLHSYVCEANVRMQAGISETVGALTHVRRTSSSTAGGAPAAVRGCDGGSAHRVKLSGRDAETCGVYRWLGDIGLPEGFQILSLSCNGSKGTGERCMLAHVDSRSAAMPVTRSSCRRSSSALTEPPVTDMLAQQGVRRRSQSNEENRYMLKSVMIGTEGEITAIYRGGVRHAEV
jgi:hypothetical protein